MTGEELDAIGITEPTGGSDAIGGMQARDVKKGSYYVINGEKRFITNGSRAKYILLYAVTNPEVKRHQGISAFIFPTDTEGFKVVKDYELLGRLGSVNSRLVFKDCKVPEENLLGEENGGLKVLMEGLDSERTFTSSPVPRHRSVSLRNSHQVRRRKSAIQETHKGVRRGKLQDSGHVRQH